MTKRLVEIDDELLARARVAARAGTIKGTVEAALQRLVEQDIALRHIRRLRSSGAPNLALVEVARQAGTSDG